MKSHHYNYILMENYLILTYLGYFHNELQSAKKNNYLYLNHRNNGHIKETNSDIVEDNKCIIQGQLYSYDFNDAIQSLEAAYEINLSYLYDTELKQLETIVSGI